MQYRVEAIITTTGEALCLCQSEDKWRCVAGCVAVKNMLEVLPRSPMVILQVLDQNDVSEYYDKVGE